MGYIGYANWGTKQISDLLADEFYEDEVRGLLSGCTTRVDADRALRDWVDERIEDEKDPELRERPFTEAYIEDGRQNIDWVALTNEILGEE
jgi:hypothetical protein